MLKFTNSFCRYLKLTCETIISYSNKTHVKKFTLTTSTQQTCNGVKSVLNCGHSTPFILTRQHTKFYSNIKKRLYPKKSTKYTNVSKKNNQMSESLKPTLNHVSYGGQFEISSDNSSSGSDWKKTVTNPSANSSDDWSSAIRDGTNNTDKKESCSIPPDFRIWEQVLKKTDANEGKVFKFKVLSYNVLAQYLLECHPYLYTDCHPYNLKWKVRAARLYDEIIKLSPDILCLQEVQASHINTFYSKFEDIGYCGIYKQKTGQRQDGCAIYFKLSLFEMHDHNSSSVAEWLKTEPIKIRHVCLSVSHSHFTPEPLAVELHRCQVEYYQPEIPILNRDNIGIMVKLMPKDYFGPPIVVATTHLLYNPKRTDVRLAQVQVLLAELDRFAYYNNGRESGHVPVIITGDLNSTPDSAVVKLLDRGHVSATPFRDSSDWKKIGVTDNCQHLSVYLNRQKGLTTEFCMTKIYNSDYRQSLPELEDPTPISNDYSDLFNTGVITHSLNLKSTYNKYKSDGCYEATTFQDYWVTVDYIYFSYCSTLRLVERLRLPTAGECDVLGRLPNDAYGSDHLALAAVFELKSVASSL